MATRHAIIFLIAAALSGEAYACDDEAKAAPVPQAQVQQQPAQVQPAKAPQQAQSWKDPQARFFPLSKVKISPKAVRLRPANPAPAVILPQGKAQSGPLTGNQAQQLLSIYQ